MPGTAFVRPICSEGEQLVGNRCVVFNDIKPPKKELKKAINPNCKYTFYKKRFPEKCQPVMTEPVTTTLVTTEPVTPKLVTTKPVTPKLVTTNSVTTMLATTKPVTPKLVTTKPVTTMLATTKPVTPKLVTTKPVTTILVTTKPVTPKPKVQELPLQRHVPKNVTKDMI